MGGGRGQMSKFGSPLPNGHNRCSEQRCALQREREGGREGGREERKGGMYTAQEAVGRGETPRTALVPWMSSDAGSVPPNSLVHRFWMYSGVICTKEMRE